MQELAEQVCALEARLAEAGDAGGAETAERASLYRELLAALRARQGTGLPPQSRLEALWADLRAELAAILEKGISGTDPWRSRQVELAEAMRQRLPVDFLQWPVVRKAAIQSWRMDEALEARQMLAESPAAARWLKVIRDSAVGAPSPLEGHPGESINSAFVASHLCRFEAATGCAMSDFDTIVEFGGGYGAMCRTAFRAGFAGRYVIFDLPVISAIQRFYLRATGLPHYRANVLASAPQGVATVSDVAALSELAAPGAAGVRRVGDDRGRSLFIATWSLTESPLAVRAAMEPFIKSASAVLMCYQSAFGGIDNKRYVHRLAGEMPHLTWREQRLARQPLNYYLFGHADGTGATAHLHRESLIEKAGRNILRWTGPLFSS